MLTRGVLAGIAVALWSAGATSALAQEKPLIRWGYLMPPTTQMASVFTLKPEILRHYGKTYDFETKYVRATPLLVTAFAAGEIEVGNLGYTSLPQAITNAGMTDMKVIGDEVEDGFPGQFASEIRVRKDSGINSIADLKGKVIATMALGSGADMLVRYALRKQGLELNRDFTYLETAYPTMKAMLIEKKVAAAFFGQPFSSDPEVLEHTKILFTSASTTGPLMQNFLAARGGFIAKHRAAMIDFLEDFLRVVRWHYDPANRDEAIKIVSDASKVPESVLRRYIFIKERDLYRNLDGLPDLNVLQNNWSALKELGLMKQELNVNDHADLSLMKEAAARLKQ